MRTGREETHAVMARIGRSTLAAVLAVPFVLGAVLAGALASSDGGAPGLVVPTTWRAVWDAAHVRVGEHVALAWGDRAGEDPRAAADDLAFDPAAAVARLEALHALHADLGLGPAEGPAAGRKVLVVVDGTWSGGPGVRAAPPGEPVRGDASRAEVLDDVGIVRVTPAVLAPDGEGATDATQAPAPPGGVEAGTSWELARAAAEVALRLTEGGPDGGPPGAAAEHFRSTSAAYLATLAVPDGHAGVGELLRASHLAWGSARHGAAGWLLLDSLVARADPGVVADLWTRSRDDETVLAAYARLTSTSPEVLNRRVAQHALRVAAGDAGARPGAAPVEAVDPVLLADLSTPTEPVPGDPAHHRVVGAFAPGAYGFTIVRLVPDGSGGDVRVRLRGHAEALEPGTAGWSVGMVALGPAGPRYGPVTETADGEVTLTPRAGEETVLLVVTATPPAVPTAAPGAFPTTTRYPYEFRVGGAVVADPVATEPAAGGHRHPNGGGWVDDRASVDATAWVGPHAVVRGAAQVRDQARLEGRAWVEDGAVVEDRAVVRDVARVAGGAHLSGEVVVGGDAVVTTACSSGEHTAYRADGGCRDEDAPADVNPPVTPFTAEETALSAPAVPPAPQSPPGPVDPAPASPPAPAEGGTPAPPVGGPGGDGSGDGGATGGAGAGTPPPAAPVPPSPGVVAPPPAVPAGACTARYEVLTSWPGGYQVQVTVTASAPGVQGWLVQWDAVPGGGITDSWGAEIGTGGGTVSAENLSWNGSVANGQSVVFGFTGPAEGDAAQVVPQVRCTQTR
ncbi:DUF6055 domain-containing protein [Cellulomonas telluris]|uniref:DUF6055 domain-containing protein n=1 Tax=Cellulomonas telluris TaxID=2306636 RepID=UPI0010A83A95|nr:DUF6055 domain-containing protein [Cellulomonas telluris]